MHRRLTAVFNKPVSHLLLSLGFLLSCCTDHPKTLICYLSLDPTLVSREIFIAPEEQVLCLKLENQPLVLVVK